jgi:thiamine biosynthesis lipoprotein
LSATTSWRALGTTATVVVDRDDALSRASEILRNRLERFDDACSRFRADSDLTRACTSDGAPVRVDPLLLRAVEIAIDAAEQTGGLVDPTLGAALRRAGYDATFELVQRRTSWRVAPPPAAEHARWRHVRIDESRRTLTVPRGVELDLGATAKALAADLSAGAIAEELGCGTLVCLGGDVAVAGTASQSWIVRIADDHATPLDAEGPVVCLQRGGLATSGSAVRRWRTDTGEAHHLIDPRSGRPAREVWKTVTVAAETCVAANVASTAAYVLGETAIGWLAERGLAARLVSAGGELRHTDAWPLRAEAA